MVQEKIPLIQNAHDAETRNIINKVINTLNGLGYTYDQSLQMARNILNEAQRTNDMNSEVNKRLDNIIASSGTSSTELVDARGTHTVLNSRLDESDDRLYDTERVINVLHHGAKGDGVTDDWSAIQEAISLAESSNRPVYLPTGTYYVSKALVLRHMTSYNYRYGIKFYGNGKDTIITRKHNRQVADYSVMSNLWSQAALAIFGANNIVEDISFDDSKVGVYIGQDPSQGTVRSSASMNRFNNIWMEYVGTGLLFIHGSGNHYNTFNNFHIIHSQISVHLGKGFFLDQFNNNRNVFTNFRVSRSWIGWLLEQTDGNFFNNVYAETFEGDQALGSTPPAQLPAELNGKKTVIVALDGQYNTFSNFAHEACEWDIYSVGYRNSFTNGMIKDDTIATMKVLFPNPIRQPLNYTANSMISGGFMYQSETGILFPGSNGTGLKTPWRMFDIGFHRQSIDIVSSSSEIASEVSGSRSQASRLARKVDWSVYTRFVGNFSERDGEGYSTSPVRIKLPFPETPESTYTSTTAGSLTKPFPAFVGNSFGADEVVSARISTASEASAYGGYHVLVNPPARGWRHNVNTNFLSFDISWHV